MIILKYIEIIEAFKFVWSILQFGYTCNYSPNNNGKIRKSYQKLQLSNKLVYRLYYYKYLDN